jgi:hypothetical protein
VINGNVINPAGANWPRIKRFLTFIGIHETGTAPAVGPGVVAAGLLGIRYHDPSIAWSNLTNLTPIGPGNVTFNAQPQVAAPAAGVQPKYQFRRLPSPWRVYNRVWTWQANNTPAPPGAPTTTFGTKRSALPSDVYNQPAPGQIRLFQNLYGPLSQYTIIGLRSRKTGRLFHQLRGRSSNRA